MEAMQRLHIATPPLYRSSRVFLVSVHRRFWSGRNERKYSLNCNRCVDPMGREGGFETLYMTINYGYSRKLVVRL